MGWFSFAFSAPSPNKQINFFLSSMGGKVVFSRIIGLWRLAFSEPMNRKTVAQNERLFFKNKPRARILSYTELTRMGFICLLLLRCPRGCKHPQSWPLPSHSQSLDREFIEDSEILFSFRFIPILSCCHGNKDDQDLELLDPCVSLIWIQNWWVIVH